MLTTTQTYAALILLAWTIAWPVTFYWLGTRRSQRKSWQAGHTQGTTEARQQITTQQDARWRAQRNEIEQLHTQLKQAQSKLAELRRPFDERDATTLHHAGRELITLAATYEGFQAHKHATEARTLANLCTRMAERITPAEDQAIALEVAA